MNNKRDVLRLIYQAVPIDLRNFIYKRRLLNALEVQWKSQNTVERHNLKGKLIVSLTSYRPRFSNLHLTIKSLLSQSVKADHIVLWVADQDYRFLPNSVLQLAESGLTIKVCRDLKSYKKLIPANKFFPDSFLVSADDDIFYGRNWLRDLVVGYNDSPRHVICHRAHLISKNEADQIKPYMEWPNASENFKVSELVLPTTGAGCLFPPGALDFDVGMTEDLVSIAPSQDDIGFYFIMRSNRYSARKIGPWPKLVVWPGSQHVSLAPKNNFEGGNDRAFKALASRFGDPTGVIQS